MSFAAINWAWEQLDLPPGPKVVLMGLAHVADDANAAWPSIGTLAVRANVSAMTVRRYIQHLVDEGLVSIERRQRPDGSFASNVYRLHVETPALPLSRAPEKAAGKGRSQSEGVYSQIDTAPPQDERGGTPKLSGGTLTGDTCNDLPITLKEKNSIADAREGEPCHETAGAAEGEAPDESPPDDDQTGDNPMDDDPTDRGVWRAAQGREPLDPGFRLPPEWRGYVCERYDLGVDAVETMAESFKLHWLEKGAARVDWRAAFIEWVKTSIALAAERQGRDGLAEVARRGRGRRKGPKALTESVSFSKPAEARDLRFEHLRRALSTMIGGATYKSWIDAAALRLDAPHLVVACRSAFVADEVRKRFAFPLRRAAVSAGFGEAIEIRIEGPERKVA